MKIARSVTFWLFVCCLPLLIIATNIGCGVSTVKLYEYGFDKYHISHVTGIDELELSKTAQHLVDYFNLKIDTAQVTVLKNGGEFDLFNERELVHLQDVRSLIQLDYWVWRGTLALMVICVLVLLLWLKSDWRILIKGLLCGSLVVLGLVIGLAFWAIFGFDRLFILFHLVSFSNELWILDPAKDYLIMLFPEGFFYDAALFGFGAVIVEAILLGGITFGILKANDGGIVFRRVVESD